MGKRLVLCGFVLHAFAGELVAFECSDLSLIAAGDLVPQHVVSREAGGDGNGFCGTTCLINFEAIVLTKLSGQRTKADLSKVRDIVSSIKEMRPGTAPSHIDSELTHQLIVRLLNSRANTKNLQVTGLKLVRTFPEARSRHGLEQTRDLSVENVVGTKSNPSLSMVGITVYDKGGEPIIRHMVVVIPDKPGSSRVRVMDFRFGDRVFYANLAKNDSGAPHLKFEDNEYLTLYRNLVQQRRGGELPMLLHPVVEYVTRVQRGKDGQKNSEPDFFDDY